MNIVKIGTLVYTQREHPLADDLEIVLDQAIAACDGDLRRTIKARVVANDF